MAIGLLAFSSQTADPPKPPWLWSSEERIARRIDPRARNVRRSRELQPREGVRVVTKARDGWSPLNGSIEPELLFPWELLRTLVESTDARFPNRVSSRERYRSAISANSWDYDAFWAAIDSAASPYLVLMSQSREAQRLSQGRADLRQLDPLICAALAELQNRMRDSFGAIKFDQFLYTAIAPDLRVWVDDRAETAAQLRATESGCR